MRAAAGVNEFAASPVGRYFLGERFLIWCRDPGLFGCVYRGRVEDAHVAEGLAALEAELHPTLAGHASLADLRRLEGASPEAFEALAGYLESRRARLGAAIARQAILRPGGMLGALVAGFYEVHAAAYPARSFAEPREALEWLGVPGGAEALAEIDALHEALAGQPAVVRALRDALRGASPAPPVDKLARTLGVSTRTLQRALAAAGTSFQREVARARVEAAKALLEGSDASLTAIALEVGCSSLQHFSGMFRRVTGETPSAWRQRRGPRAGRNVVGA